MKLIFLFLVFTSTSNVILAQYLDGKKMSDIDSKLFEVRINKSLFGSEYNIKIAYGLKDECDWVKNVKKEKMSFASLIASLNFLENNGLKLISTYNIDDSKLSAVYFFRKE